MVLRQRIRRLKEPVTHRKGQGSHSNGEYNKYHLLSVRYDAYMQHLPLGVLSPQASSCMVAICIRLLPYAKCHLSQVQLQSMISITKEGTYQCHRILHPIINPLIFLVKSNLYHALAMLLVK